MASTPTKRRKISPSTAVPVTNENTQARPTSKDREPSSSRRASFLSPTKASLARFNPSLLPTKSGESQRPRSRGFDSRASPTRDGVIEETVRSSGLDEVTNGASTKPVSGTNGLGLRAIPRDGLRIPRDDNTSLERARSAVPQDLRASPPAGDGDETSKATPLEVNTDGAIGHNDTPHGGSAPLAQAARQVSQHPATPPNPGLPRISSGMGRSDDGEPSLPSTPIHLGIEKPPERPKGLLFNSPNRRRRREESALRKSSPLRPQDSATDLAVSQSQRVHTNLGPRIYIPNTPQPPPTNEETELNRMQEKLAGLETRLQEIEGSLICQSLVSKWQQEEGKEAKEFSKRNREALQTSRKVVRFREELVRKRNDQATRLMDQDHAMGDGSTILRGDNASSSIFPVPLSLVQRLDRFLPFSVHAPVRDASPKHDARGTDAPEDITNPFTISITDAILLPSTADGVLQQRQDLLLCSAQQILRAKLQATVNIPTQTIETLQIKGMSPWADRELGGWMRALPMDSNLSVIGTAFGKYYEMARTRAQCFLDAERGLKTLIADPKTLEHTGDARLSNYFGNQDISFSREHVTLDIAWLASFGDDGDVESHVTARAKFPDTWRRTAGADLDRIGDAFDLLAKERGVLEAIRVVCKLIFSP